MGTLMPGKLPHLLLSMACAEPMTTPQLGDRLAIKGKGVFKDLSLVQTGRRLEALGYLRREGQTTQRAPLYVLTREGEEALDDLEIEAWAQREGAA